MHVVNVIVLRDADPALKDLPHSPKKCVLGDPTSSANFAHI